MKGISISTSLAACVFLALAPSAIARHTGGVQDNGQVVHSDSRRTQTQVASGQKMKVEGTVIKRDGNSFVLRETTGSQITVNMSGGTKVREKKSNPFRGSKKYSSEQVMRGLFVEVEGRGDGSGALMAEEIKFSRDAQRTAVSIDSQVTPVENRMGRAETRLSEAEQNAQRLAGQVDELTQVANLAKGGAAQAQKTADIAIEGVNRTNDRITSLDDYQEKTTSTVLFRVGSAILSPDAKAELDKIADQAKIEKGFVIEVRGFASAEGGTHLNDRLSEERANAVVRYLAQQQQIPLRRIVLPFGYGKAMPVADNSTRTGRIQNRRVEVKILVSRGLTNPVSVTSATGGGQD